MKSIKKGALVLLALLLVFAAFSPAVFAADVPVSTYAQLQDAINSASGPTNIIISNNINFIDFITITSGKDITIKSSEGNNFTLLAAEGYRHFSVGGNTALTLENITLEGAYSGSGGYRGGIANFGALTLNPGAAIRGCYAFDGGGINNEGGTVNISGGEISGNTAIGGAGIYNGHASIINISSGAITGNTADDGGGIFNHQPNSVVNISGGAISNNIASNWGGGIYCKGGAIDISGGEISKNAATEGGGICSYETVTMSGGIISDNQAEEGGGIFNRRAVIIRNGVIKGNKATVGGGINGSDISISGGEISANTATNGGGIYTASGGTATISGGEIKGNTAAGYGGGICSWGAITIYGGGINMNTASEGGGVYGLSRVTVSAGEISYNSAVYDGGGIGGYGTVSISGGEICGNTAYCGGGIGRDSAVTISGGKISGNTAIDIGGGIFSKSGPVNIYSGLICNNTAANGGGIYSNTVNINGGVISNNYATNGGGVVCWGGYVWGGEISGNLAKNGGGMWNWGTITISGGEICGNSAEFDGGGLYNSYFVYITGGEIKGNSAENGGGIYNDHAALTISCGDICDNLAVNGGGIYNSIDGYQYDSAINMKDSKFIGNKATNSGGGIWTSDLTKVTVYDTIFSGNTAWQAYWMTDLADIATYNNKIFGVYQFSAPPAGNKPFEYAYNNYDIGYTKGLTENPILDTYLKVSSAEGRAGEIVSIPASIINSPGVKMFQLALEYDNSKLEFVSQASGPSFDHTALLRTGDPRQVAGDIWEVQITYLGDLLNPVTVYGDTILCALEFKIRGNAATGETPLTLKPANSYILYGSNNEVYPSIVNGEVSIIDYILGDINGDGKISLADLSLLAQYFIGGYGIEVSYPLIYKTGDMDRNGKLELNDLALLQNIVINGAPALAMAAPRAVALSGAAPVHSSGAAITAPVVKGNAGEKVFVPVAIEASPGIKMFQLALQFDNSKLEFVSQSSGEAFADQTHPRYGDPKQIEGDSWEVQVTYTGGLLDPRITYGDVTLCNFEFLIRGNAAAGETPLMLKPGNSYCVSGADICIYPLINNGGITVVSAQETVRITGGVLYQPSTRPAKVELRNNAGGQTITTFTDAADGAYELTIPLAPAGTTYTLKITKPGYLSYTIKNLSLAEVEEIEAIDIRQLAGDVNGDGIVNAVDLTCLLSEFNREPLSFPNADIDGNGIVNAADLTYLLAGFNKRTVIVGG